MSDKLDDLSSVRKSPKKDLTLKDIILRVDDFRKEVGNNKWWVLGSALLLASIFFIIAFNTQPTYSSDMTFLMEEEDAAGGIGISSILGQFGLGGGGAQQNLDKVVEVARSQKIIDKVLLESKTLNGKQDFLINHIIDLYHLRDDWQEDTLLRTVYFTHKNIDNYTISEHIVFKQIAEMLTGNPSEGVIALVQIGYTIETGILYINGTLFDENLTIELVKTFYDKLSDYYLKESVQKQQKTLDLLQHRTDSVLTILQTTEKQLAYIEDKSEGLIRRKNRLYKEQLAREKQVLTIMYGELLKNKETSSFLLDSKTPFFQVLNEPRRPLLPIVPSKIGAILVGGILGLLLSAFFIIMRKVFREIMA